MDAPSVIDRIATSTVLIDLWSRYQKKYSYAADVTWEKVIESVRKLASVLGYEK